MAASGLGLARRATYLCKEDSPGKRASERILNVEKKVQQICLPTHFRGTVSIMRIHVKFNDIAIVPQQYCCIDKKFTNTPIKIKSLYSNDYTISGPMGSGV
jgi:hypothetical protein